MADNEQGSAAMPNEAANVGIGGRLKAAREAAGFSLAQMSGETKIPARMLELIEAGNFAALPARTYATGFTRSYARALGMDEGEAVAAVRAQLGMYTQAEPRLANTFEPGDPARVPTARFAWAAAVAALVVVAAGLFLWRNYYAPAVSLPSILPEDAASAAPSTTVPSYVPAPAPLPTADPFATQPAATALPAPAAPAPARRPLIHSSAPGAASLVTAVPEAPPAASPAPASTAQN